MYKTFLLTLLLLSGVAHAQDIEMECDSSANFDRYETYRWMPTSVLLRGSLPEYASSDEVIDSLIKAAVDKALDSKGLQKKSSKPSDLLVNYFGLVSYRFIDFDEFRAKYRSEEYVPYEHWRPMYEGAEDGYMSREGSLTVDLVDSGTNKLVCRGKVTQAVEQIGGPENEAKINAAVEKLFESFPPN